MSDERKMVALSIMSSPDLFKICEGCDSICNTTLIYVGIVKAIGLTRPQMIL